jgi:hypothetical protein
VTTLSLEQIYSDIINKRISKEKAIDTLTSLIENSDDDRVRTSCIDLFNTLMLKEEKVYDILEYCLVSDEKSLVRNAAVQALISNFPEKCIQPLKWTIRNDSSIIVLKTLFDILLTNNDLGLRKLKSKLLRRLSKIYGVVPWEIKLFIYLETLHAEYTRNPEHEINTEWYKIIRRLRKYPYADSLITRLSYLKYGGISLPPLAASKGSYSCLKKLYYNENKDNITFYSENIKKNHMSTTCGQV